MNKISTFIGCMFLITSLAMSSAMAETDLVRGETRIDVPAIADGLCVHNMFQSNMVLQRDKPIGIRGWATAGEKVSVSFNGKQESATAEKDRSWKVTFPAMDASAEARTITVTGAEATLKLENILVGDVWILGGQSNMEFPISKIVDGDLEIASANFKNIRLLTIPSLNGSDQQKSFPGQYQWSSWSGRHFRQGFWDVCSPETVKELSGIGYVFARRLHMATQVPIGVVDASRGGTTVETWTPDSVLREIGTPEVKALMTRWDEKVAAFDPEEDLKAQIKKHVEWIARMKKAGRPTDKKAPSEQRPGPAMDQNRPGNCYASMIAPIAGFPVKGAIFHQGYNNAMGLGSRNVSAYYQIFGPMITAWRKAFNDPEMAFGIISLCTGGAPQDMDTYLERMADNGIYIRATQYQTFLDFRKAGDETIGFASSFDQRRSWYHPQIKVAVGERIARWALATQYDLKKLAWEPVTYKDVVAEEGRLLVKMNGNTGAHNDGPILGFAIAGEDGKWQPASVDFLVTGKDSRNRPKKDNKTLVLSSPLVPAPVHFRYAWARNPVANLKTAGIPFATQRSDSWTIEETYESYMGGTVIVPGELDRGEVSKLRKALQAGDLERRLKAAEALLEAHREKVDK